MTTVGIDVSKRWLDVVVRQAEGREERLHVKTERRALARLAQRLVAVAPAWVVLEATGAYHEPVVVVVQAAGLQVSLLNPVQLVAYRKLEQERTKTDRRDAQLLAQYAQERHTTLRVYVPPTPEQRHLRARVRYREQRTRSRTRLQGLAEAAQAEGSAALCALVEADLVQTAARLRAVDRELRRALQALPQGRVLLGVRGVGVVLAASLLGYVPTHLWTKPKQLVAYVGLHPRVHHSGSSRKRSVLSKQGNARIRRALYMVALGLIRQGSKADPHWRQRYEHLCAKGKAPQSAVCIVMHGFLRQLSGILKAQERALTAA